MLGVLVFVFSGCSGGDGPTDPGSGGTNTNCPNPIPVTQTIDSPTRWSPGKAGCTHYLVSGSITVFGSIVVDPGTTVAFDAGSKLDIRSGSLSAIGTAAQQIRFIGSQSVRGHWQGIHISTNSSSNELTYVEVAHGGGSGRINGGDVVVEPFGRVRITHSTLHESLASGLFADHAAELSEFSTNRLVDNAGSGARVHTNLIGSLDTQSEYLAGNGKTYIDAYAEDIDDSQQWRITSLPIRITGTVIVWQSLSIAPGCTILFAADGKILVQGSLSAVGTSSQPIKFLGQVSSRGYWAGIAFSSSSSANELSYVEVAHAGGVGGVNAADVVLEPFARARIQNSTLRESANSGLYAGPNAILDAFIKNVLRNNAGAGIRIPDNVVGSLDTQSDYTTGNGKNYLDVYADEIDVAQTWRVTSAPIHFTGRTTIWSNLSIASGVTVIMGANARWQVQGSLSAVGTTSAMVKLIGEQQAKGFWEGIIFSSTSPSNEFAYVEVAYGGGVGGATAGNVVVTPFNRLRITNSILRESAGWGLFVDTSGTVTPTPVSSGGNTFSSNTRGGSNVP